MASAPPLEKKNIKILNMRLTHVFRIRSTTRSDIPDNHLVSNIEKEVHRFVGR